MLTQNSFSGFSSMMNNSKFINRDKMINLKHLNSSPSPDEGSARRPGLKLQVQST